MTDLYISLISKREELLQLRNNCLKLHSPYKEKLTLDKKKNTIYYRSRSTLKYLGTINNPMVQQLLIDGILDVILEEVDLRLDIIDQLQGFLTPISVREIDNNWIQRIAIILVRFGKSFHWLIRSSCLPRSPPKTRISIPNI